MIRKIVFAGEILASIKSRGSDLLCRTGDCYEFLRRLDSAALFNLYKLFLKTTVSHQLRFQALIFYDIQLIAVKISSADRHHVISSAGGAATRAVRSIFSTSGNPDKQIDREH